MKKFIIISILMALFASGNSLMAQDNQGESLGLPGDNLNLYAVMKLFQESKTLEDFERSLNDQNSTIDRKSTRLNSSHANISYAVFCLKKNKKQISTHKLFDTSAASTHRATLS